MINRVIWNAPCPYDGVGTTPAFEVVYPLFAHWMLTFFPNSFLGGFLNSFVGCFILFLSLSVFVQRRLKNLTFICKMVILFACFCAWQVPYVFERSNQLPYAAGLVALFLALYDSNRFWERCVAAVALAMAAALKVSPALFGVVYFVSPFKSATRRRMDWISVGICVMAAFVLVFGPFWWHGQGFVEITRLYRNVVENAGRYMRGAAWGIVAIWRELAFVGSAPSGLTFGVARFSNVGLGIIGLVASVLPNRFGVRPHERLLFSASAVMLLPTNTCSYTALYLFPAFLMTESHDWKMHVLWLMLFLPIQIPAELLLNVHGLVLNPTISNLAFLGLLVLAYSRCVIRIRRLGN